MAIGKRVNYEALFEDIIVDEHGQKHIISERGVDYIIFKHDNGSRYISSKLSGNVPRWFFPEPEGRKEEFDWVMGAGDNYVVYKDQCGFLYYDERETYFYDIPEYYQKDIIKKRNYGDYYSIDLRNINQAYFISTEDVEWFKKPTKFFHFRKLIDLLDVGSMDFYDELKYRILNQIPTKRRGIEDKVYEYLNDKFGKKKLEEIIKRCVRYKLKKEGKIY